MAKRALTSVTTEALQKELSRRSRNAAPLHRKRERLLEQLAKIEKELDALGELNSTGTPGKSVKAPAAASSSDSPRKRPKNEMPLIEAIEMVMKNKKPMKIAEVIDAVLASGYQSSASNFRIIVSQTLSGYEHFERVARGVYQMKG